MRREITQTDEDILDTDSEVDEFAEADEGQGVSQWAPDEWELDGSEESEEEADVNELRDNLKSVPLSALLKAQRTLDRNADPGPSNSTVRLQQTKKGKGKELDMEEDALLQARLRREHKHAPATMSSKKQVSRSRNVIDVPKPQRRDPRFDNVSAGRVDPHLHAQSYEFLPTMLRDELAGLKTALSMALKAEKTCPWAEKPARIAERERLEGHLGQLRTKIERREREAREREVLSRVKKEEREKREKGKGAWHMKKGERRDLLIKAKFDELEKQGGKTAVKKAVEKKRKKIAHKEKKSRPFARGEDGKRRRIA